MGVGRITEQVCFVFLALDYMNLCFKINKCCFHIWGLLYIVSCRMGWIRMDQSEWFSDMCALSWTIFCWHTLYMFVWISCKTMDARYTVNDFLLQVGYLCMGFPILKMYWGNHGFWHIRACGKKLYVYSIFREIHTRVLFCCELYKLLGATSLGEPVITSININLINPTMHQTNIPWCPIV